MIFYNGRKITTTLTKPGSGSKPKGTVHRLDMRGAPGT